VKTKKRPPKAAKPAAGSPTQKLLAQFDENRRRRDKRASSR
jgi:hypothetical protein